MAETTLTPADYAAIAAESGITCVECNGAPATRLMVVTYKTGARVDLTVCGDCVAISAQALKTFGLARGYEIYDITPDSARVAAPARGGEER